MPELPEAETIARQLHRALTGRTLGQVSLARTDIVNGDPRPLGKLLPGRRVARVSRRAKRVILTLDGGIKLVFRLGMTGRMIVCPTDDPVEKHTHLRITIDGTCNELRFCDARRFGGVWCLTGSERSIVKPLGEVGLEPLDATPPAFRVALSCRRQIKALLMDQTVIAGLGNIYCDESLHAAGIHPLTRSDTLGSERADRLLRAIRMTLRKAIRFNGSTLMDYRDADGREGSFQKHHRVYQRRGQPCRTCNAPIRRILAAGRSTFFCPKCQTKKTQKRRNAETGGTKALRH